MAEYQMKMYHFNTGEVGDNNYTVLAGSKEMALEYLKVYFAHVDEFPPRNVKDWMDATVNNLPNGYSSPYLIEEFEAGQVMLSRWD
jgi:hypothetical protein